MGNTSNYREGERGNVLFLILIAVALFAALSYAVTQSTRGGGGSAEKEQSLLSSATMTQYPTALRTSLVRMILSGTSTSDLKFNPPSDFAAVTDDSFLVFNKDGGAASYQKAPADIMAGSSEGTWLFNGSWDIPEIGSDGAGGNDIIAFLPRISQSVCKQINREMTISNTGCTSDDGVIPDLNVSTNSANIDLYMDHSYTLPTSNQEDLANSTCSAFTGKASGCFFDDDNSRYVFYSVLLER